MKRHHKLSGDWYWLGGLASMLVLTLAPLAQANTVTYDLTFASPIANFGSGMVTFDDTPTGPGASISGSTRYLFPSVVGSSTIGHWSSSGTFFDYNSATGEGNWVLNLAEGRWVADNPANVGPGLPPIAALEQIFVGMGGSGWLGWTREAASGVPDSGSSLALLGLTMVGCAGLKRRLGKPEQF